MSSKAVSIIVFAVATVAAIYAYVSYPWTKDQCGRWAAERSSAHAVGAALLHCRNRFGERTEARPSSATIAPPSAVSTTKGADSQVSRPQDAAVPSTFGDEERTRSEPSASLKEFHGVLDTPKPPSATVSAAAIRWSPNGQPWPTVASYLKGKGLRQLALGGLSQLAIDNTDGGADVYVKLCRSSSDRCDGLRHVFIPVGASFTLNSIAPGRYDIRYRALDNGALAKSEPLELVQVKEADGTRYSKVRLTLYRVAGGNTSFEALPEDKF